MKKSLSLMVAASAAVALIPMTFAESSSSAMSSAASSSFVSSVSSTSSAASSSSVSSSSSSSAASLAPCMEKTGAERIVCLNDMIRMRKEKSKELSDVRNSKIQAIATACADKTGMAKNNCLRKSAKSVIKTESKVLQKVMLRSLEQSNALAKCASKRGKALALCFKDMRKTTVHSMNKSSSSASSASSASSTSSAL